ncbi:MAG: hypothetical protein ACOQNY_02165 [Mycoplasmoidaceae bacterium]
MKKKNKKYIIFPCLACGTALAFAIPVLSQISSGHISMDYSHQRWAKITVPDETTFKYTFILDEKIDENAQKMVMTVEESPYHSDAACIVEISDDYEVDESRTRIYQNIRLVRRDKDFLHYFDYAFFDIHFALVDRETNRVLWTDRIDTLRLRYEPEW